MSSRPAPAAAQRLDGLTGLRWWAALAVFVFHMRNIVQWPTGIEMFAKYGYLGVTFFFVLSGFVLTWSWRPSVGVGTFYWRRIARIYPLHVVTLLLAIPVFYRFTLDPSMPWIKPVDVGILMLSVLLLQGWSSQATILFSGNPAAWTLTAEFFFYFSHPWIMRLLQRVRVRGALLAVACVGLLNVLTRHHLITHPTSWLATLPIPVQRINEFVIGMCLAWALRHGWRPRIPLVVPVILLVGYVASFVIFGGGRWSWGHAIVVKYVVEIPTLLFALLVVTWASAELRGKAGAMMKSKVLVALGEWSFAFYLIHATLIYLAMEFFGRVPSSAGIGAILLTALALFVAALVGSWLLHGYVEKPTESRLRRWQDGVRERWSHRMTGVGPAA